MSLRRALVLFFFAVCLTAAADAEAQCPQGANSGPVGRPPRRDLVGAAVEFATCPPGTEWLPGCDWLPNTAADAAESVEHWFGISTPNVSGPPPPPSAEDQLLKWCDCNGGIASLVMPNANSSDVYALMCNNGARCRKQHNKQAECLTAAQAKAPRPAPPPPPCMRGYKHRGADCVADCPPNQVLQNGGCQSCPAGTAAFFIAEGPLTPGVCVESKAADFAHQAEKRWLPGCPDLDCVRALVVLALAFANDAMAIDPSGFMSGGQYTATVSNLRATHYDPEAKILAACGRDPHHRWDGTYCGCGDGFVQSIDGTCYRPTSKTVHMCGPGTWSKTGWAPERGFGICAKCPAGKVSTRDHKSCETCGVAFAPASDAGSCRFKKLTTQHVPPGKIQMTPTRIH
jgi:hypothetical protein